MWLISNPLFEIGAGLVLFAATIWMLLNATAPRPAALQTPVAPTPTPLTVAELVPSLGPLSVRAAKGMFFADEIDGAGAEPPLHLAPEPPASISPPSDLRLSASESTWAVEPPAPSPDAEEVASHPVSPAPPAPADPSPSDPEPVSVEPPAPAVIAEGPRPIAREPVGPPSLAPDPVEPAVAEAEPAAVEAAAEPASRSEPPSLLEEFGEALAAASVMPSGPPSAVEPVPSLPFDAQLQDWLRGLLDETPAAPPLATVTAAAARVKRRVDPDWPEPARDLWATLESLGKLAPAVFAAPGRREATAAIVEAAETPVALIWPEAGAAFDPAAHEARSGEGEAVAAVIRPGLAYAGVTVLPALVVRVPASSSSASG